MTLIPPNYLNAVVSIEIETDRLKEDGTKYKEPQPIATGYLYGKFVKAEGDIKEYRTYLVTNRHVFQDPISKKYLKNAMLRLNLSGKQGTKYALVDLLDKEGKPLWLSHNNENVDLAVLSINAQTLAREGIEYYFFREDEDIFLAKDFEESGVSVGDGVFVLGFPLGERGVSRNFVIVKGGIIARCDEELLKDHYFLIDAAVYPGNSGGPVINKPEAIAIQGTKSVGKTGLIGVISSGISYQERAISEQTGRPRIIFEEQTGLVKIVPIDSVNETIDQFVKINGEPKKTEEVKMSNKGVGI